MTRPHTGFPFLDAGRDDGAVLAFAHRGGAHHPDLAGLENTLVAFDHAVQLGYRYLETDVHTTRDGVLLAFHDDVLDRVTDRTRQRSPSTSYVDLADALIGGPRADPADGRPARALPRAPASTSTSSPTPPSTRWPTSSSATGAHDRVCVGSFSERRLRAVPAAGVAAGRDVLRAGRRRA